MKIPITGGCACGAIRYECSAQPIVMLKCHCRDCQRATGGGFACAVLLPRAAFTLTKGTPKYYLTPSAMIGQHKRGFCAECGSRVTAGENADSTTPFIGINAGSLDDPSWFNPTMEIWTTDAHPWDHMDPKVPQFEQYPPSS